MPVVATFASFFKRSYDQVFAAAAERVPVIFAGYYAGLDFFTDGKSHQSVNDVGFMRAIPGLEVYEPLTAREAEGLLLYLLDRMTREQRNNLPSMPAYVRLHREPAELGELSGFPFEHGAAYLFPWESAHPRRESRRPPEGSAESKGSSGEFAKSGRLHHALFAASPLMLQLALEVQRAVVESKTCLDVIGVSSYFTSARADQDKQATPANRQCRQVYDLKGILRSRGRVFALESHLKDGGLADFLARTGGVSPVRIGAQGLAGSSLSLEDMLSFHQISVAEIVKAVEQTD